MTDRKIEITAWPAGFSSRLASDHGLHGFFIHLMRLLRWPIHISVEFEWPPFIQRMFSRTIDPVVVKSVRLRNLVDTEPGEPDSLIAVLEFDDSETNLDYPDHVDLNQLRSSLDENGTFFIWTCSCGAPGCAGLFNGVDVTHSDDTTTWHDLDLNRRFVLNTQDLRDAFNRAIIDGRNLLLERPVLEATPEQNATAYYQNDG